MTTQTFRRLTARSVGTSRVQLANAAGTPYAVPTGGKVIVIGMTIANKITTSDVNATFELYDGTNYTSILPKGLVPAGNSIGPCSEMNKLVAEANDQFFVTSDTATSLDVIVSILEIV